jgi:hypothetical protein
MMQAFGHDAGGADRPSSPAPLPRFSDDTESLRVMLIGSSVGCDGDDANLHRRGFAEVGGWSPEVENSTHGSVATRTMLQYIKVNN